MVSIHARARRATYALRPAVTIVLVSIHARARRATWSLIPFHQDIFGFNPRPRAAGDGIAPIERRDGQCFNPRPRAAGDRRAARTGGRQQSFNPRPRAAGDLVSLA